MNFLEFCQSIASPALRAVALHWHEARGNKTMPAWADLNPKAIAAYLPLVWAYKFDAEVGDFVGRLAGDRIARAYGKSFRGLALGEIHTSPDGYRTGRMLLGRVMDEPAVFFGHGRVFQVDGEFRSGERIMLPLSGDGATGDGVFGATETGALPALHQPVQGYNDIGDWFSLKEFAAPVRQRA